MYCSNISDDFITKYKTQYTNKKIKNTREKFVPIKQDQQSQILYDKHFYFNQYGEG